MYFYTSASELGCHIFGEEARITPRNIYIYVRYVHKTIENLHKAVKQLNFVYD